MELSPFDKSRCRFHLGFNSGSHIPAGDAAALEEAMARIPDEVWMLEILRHLTRCDRAWEVSEVLRDTTQPLPSRIERITGDVDRAIFQSDPIRAAQIYRELYLLEVDYLAESLFVPNYRREEVRRYAFHRAGSEFIDCIPGPADTSVTTRIALHTGGSTAWR
jgi:hypothetical protein